jgi:galactokinase
MLLAEMEKLFTTLYGHGEKPRLFFAPGRVNLIGEHIDYNGGYVFPAALELGNYVYVRPNGTNTVRLAAEDLPGTMVTCDLDALESKKGRDWGAYQLGVFFELQKEGRVLPGADFLYFSNLPFGAGLSSSASIEVATAFAMLGLLGETPDRRAVSLLCQRAENLFVGVNCGIMDQYACANGEEGCAMLLDCAKVESVQVPLPLDGYVMVIGNTNKKRSLADSKYNERRAECDAALAALSEGKPGLSALCELTEEEFAALSDKITDETVRRRASHAVSENARVLASVEALKNRDLAAFGRLLNESHFSLRDLYEVTGFELDTMTELARGQEGCIGSRMTGAGFGGCTISIVKEECVAEFTEKVGAAYKEKTGLAADFYISKAGKGACEL